MEALDLRRVAPVADRGLSLPRGPRVTSESSEPAMSFRGFVICPSDRSIP
jgi:hypothetical protein